MSLAEFPRGMPFGEALPQPDSRPASRSPGKCPVPHAKAGALQAWALPNCLRGHRLDSLGGHRSFSCSLWRGKVS